MTTGMWCVAAAWLLPFVWAMLSKMGRRYDNARPRDPVPDGWQLRANWAQANAWEAFAPFAAALLIAQFVHAPQQTIDLLALAFIGFRIAHGLAYVADKPSLRSTMWLGGAACVAGLFVIAARA
ncbi:hypothetical protein E4K72_17245 [Oxalobacteraceae bacterium OM1]|nr:hypothetical protein E4K72_17245 [Oxalobacteraceae bacterium OM1]